jgi:HEAT repeat protein
MSGKSRLHLTAAVLLALTIPVARAEPEPTKGPPTDEQLLKAARVGLDAPDLLDFLHRRIPTDEDRKQVARLIDTLADDHFALRQKASAGLVAMGPGALPQLRQAALHADEEVRQRARDAAAVIDKTQPPALAAAAVRLLRQRQPDKAVPALLEYLPWADDPAVADEVLAALLALGVKDGKVDPAFPAAVADKVPERRAAAALALGKHGSADERKAVYGLLTDSDAGVRFRAAQGLLAGRDKEGVPALIDLVKEGPPDLAVQAEDLLNALAGARAPRLPVSETDVARQRSSAAWAGWWKGNGAKFDLAGADVDLPPNNPSVQARVAARQFLKGLFLSDGLAFRANSDVPFRMNNEGQVVTTREELDRYFFNYFTGLRKMTLTLKKQLAVDEYLKAAPPEEKEFLGTLKKETHRVVTAQVTLEGQGAQEVVVFVRVTGGRPCVVGFGQDRRSNPGN